MKYQKFKKQLLKDKKFKTEYEKIDLAFEIGEMIAEARAIRGITQAKLAQLINSKQPSIARLESGKTLPSLSFLKKIAKALDVNLLPPRFKFN